MAITKQFLQPNRKVRCRKPDGSETVLVVTPEMIDKVVQTGNDLIAAGYDVPLPYEHDLDVVLSIPSTRKKSIFDDPLRNSGFVTKFVKDDEGGASFVAPDDTAKGKLGKEIKHTSVYLRQKFVDTDVDRNKTWEYAPMHIALTNKPSMTGLKGFEQVPDAMLLSMDDDFGNASDDADTKDLTSTDQDMVELLKELKTRLGIRLPESTRDSDLKKTLLIAVMNAPEMVPASSLQKEGSEETSNGPDPEMKQEADDLVENPPKDAKAPKGSPNDSGAWAMSQVDYSKMTPEQLQAELKKRDDQVGVLLSQASTDKVNGFKTRRDTLKGKGVSADVLARRIEPILSKYEKKDEAVLLSQADETMLDALLSTLEETIPTHADVEDEDALLSQNYEGNADEPDADDEDSAWKFIKKANG